MESGELILRLRMIEVRYRFPVCRGMALLAFPTESPLVLIGMACGAFPRKPQVRMCEVFYSDREFVGDLHTHGRMALCAS